MSEKVTFLYNERIIQVNEGVDEISVQEDIWSYAKQVWLTDSIARRFHFPMRVVGGDQTVGDNRVSPYFFLIHGWRLRPQEANHTLQIAGTFLVEGGGDPYLDTIGTFNVRIVATVPIEAEFIVAQLPEIEFASFQNAVWYDSNSGISGISYPRGTRQSPVNNINDAIAILSVQGFGRLGLLSDATIGAGHNIEDTELFGLSTIQTKVTILPEAHTQRARFNNVLISGELDGNTTIEDCEVSNLHYVNGVIKRSTIRSDATIQIDGAAAAEIVDCNSGPPENIEAFPIIDMGGMGQSLSVRNYNGKIKLTNKSGPEKVSMDINSGHIYIDETVTNGTVVIRGSGKIENLASGDANVISEDLLNQKYIASAVWEDDMRDRALDGNHNKAGWYLSRTVNDIGYVTGISGKEVTFTGSRFNTTPGLYDGRTIQFHKGGEFIYELRKVIEHKADGVLVLDKEPVLVQASGWYAYLLNTFADDLNFEQIATTVWDTQLSEHQEIGTAGRALSTASTGGVDYDELAAAVWNALALDYDMEGSFGAKIKDLADNVEVLTNIQIGSWEIIHNQMLFYDMEGHVMFRYNLFDSSGNPSMSEVFKRELTT